LFQKYTVGCQGHIRELLDARKLAQKIIHAFSNQRFTTGNPNLGYTQIDPDVNNTQYFFIPQYFIMG
jgi:hypothetical protein